jgi:tRNA modification GTPase
LVLHVTEAGGEGPLPIARSREPQATLWIANKIDLMAAPAGAIGVSVLTGAGLPELEARLAHEVRRLTMGEVGSGFSHARHAEALVSAASAITRALGASAAELRAEELRLAMDALGRITGAVDREAVLDTIFSSFCIGK